MSNELTLFLQDTNLATSMSLSRKSSLITWSALSGVFPKQRNHYCISSHKCQVSNKCHFPISIPVLGTSSQWKKASPFPKCSAFYDEVLGEAESKSIQIKHKDNETMKMLLIFHISLIYWKWGCSYPFHFEKEIDKNYEIKFD